MQPITRCTTESPQPQAPAQRMKMPARLAQLRTSVAIGRTFCCYFVCSSPWRLMLLLKLVQTGLTLSLRQLLVEHAAVR